MGDAFVSLQLAPHFAIGILAQFQLIYMHYNSISQHNAANFRQICMPHNALLIVSATCCAPPGHSLCNWQCMYLASRISHLSQNLQINQLGAAVAVAGKQLGVAAAFKAAIHAG